MFGHYARMGPQTRLDGSADSCPLVNGRTADAEMNSVVCALDV